MDKIVALNCRITTISYLFFFFFRNIASQDDGKRMFGLDKEE